MSFGRFAGLALTLFAGILTVEGAQRSQKQQLRKRSGGPSLVSLRTNGFVRALEFKHQLRVCNAYPLESAISVFRGSEDLTKDAPMPYKECRDFKALLKAGDKLEFKVGDTSAGTFSVVDLPSNDAVLLLVIHRHDNMSSAVAFESHVFASVENAQVAVIDTFKGSAKSTPRIADDSEDAKQANSTASRSEELRFDSVVAVNPGAYKVELDDVDGNAKANANLVAVKRESYVVLRVGVESQQGQSYPQELIVFPNKDRSALQDGNAISTWAWIAHFFGFSKVAA